MSDIVDSVLSFLSDSFFFIFDWVVDFFKDIFSGRSVISVGRSILNIFLDFKIDFDIKSLFETLFGIVFIIFALKLIVNLIRG